MALSASKNTPRLGEGPIQKTFNFPQKAGTTIYPGAAVVLNGGYAAPATVALGLIAVGWYIGLAPSLGGGADGTVTIEVEPGCRIMKNSAAGDLITQADVGAECFFVDDETVAKTDGTGTRSRAGKVVKVTSEGVYVQIALGV